MVTNTRKPATRKPATRKPAAKKAYKVKVVVPIYSVLLTQGAAQKTKSILQAKNRGKAEYKVSVIKVTGKPTTKTTYKVKVVSPVYSVLLTQAAAQRAKRVLQTKNRRNPEYKVSVINASRR